MPPPLAGLCIPSLPSGANPLLWPRLALPAALPTSCLFSFRPCAAPPGPTVSPPCPLPPSEAGAGKFRTHAPLECPCVPLCSGAPSSLWPLRTEPGPVPHPELVQQEGAAQGAWPALLAAAPRARVSEKRCFWERVTMMWLMGQGADPPLLPEWPEMLLLRSRFRGILKLALGQPGFSLWPFLALFLLTWRRLGGAWGQRRFKGFPDRTPHRTEGTFWSKPQEPCLLLREQDLNHLQGIWWGQYRCDCQHRGSVHSPRPPLPWLCSGPRPSLALFSLTSTMGSPQSGLCPPPSAQLSSGRLVPPLGPRFLLQVAYSIQGCRALSHARPGRCRFIVI